MSRLLPSLLLFIALLACSTSLATAASLLLNFGPPEGLGNPFPAERAFVTTSNVSTSFCSHNGALPSLVFTPSNGGPMCVNSFDGNYWLEPVWEVRYLPTAETDLAYDCLNMTGIHGNILQFATTPYFAVALSSDGNVYTTSLGYYPASNTYNMANYNGFALANATGYNAPIAPPYKSLDCGGSLCGVLSTTQDLYLGGYAPAANSSGYNVSVGGFNFLAADLYLPHVYYFKIRPDLIMVAGNSFNLSLRTSDNIVLASVAVNTLLPPSPIWNIIYLGLTQNLGLIVTVQDYVVTCAPYGGCARSLATEAVISAQNATGSRLIQVSSTAYSIHMLFSSGAVYSLFTKPNAKSCPGFITLSPTCPYLQWILADWGSTLPANYKITHLFGNYAWAVDEVNGALASSSITYELPAINATDSTTMTLPYVWGTPGYSSGYGIYSSWALDALLPAATDLRSLPSFTWSIAKVLASDYIGLALTTNGSLLTTGVDLAGRGLYPSATPSANVSQWLLVPTSTFGGASVSDIAVGLVNSYVVLANGTLLQWGEHSALFHGGGQWSGVLSSTTFSHVFASGNTSVAVSTAGSIYAWSSSSYTATLTATPQQLSGLPAASGSTAIGDDFLVFASQTSLVFASFGHIPPFNGIVSISTAWGEYSTLPAQGTILGMAAFGTATAANLPWHVIFYNSTGLYALGSVLPWYGASPSVTTFLSPTAISLKGVTSSASIVFIAFQNSDFYILLSDGSLFASPSDPTNLYPARTSSFIQIGDSSVAFVGISSFGSAGSNILPRLAVAKPPSKSLEPPIQPTIPTSLVLNESVPYQSVFISFGVTGSLRGLAFSPFIRSVPPGHPLETVSSDKVEFFSPDGFIYDGYLDAAKTLPRVLRYTENDAPNVKNPLFMPSYLDPYLLRDINPVYWSGDIYPFTYDDAMYVVGANWTVYKILPTARTTSDLSPIVDDAYTSPHLSRSSVSTIQALHYPIYGGLALPPIKDMWSYFYVMNDTLLGDSFPAVIEAANGTVYGAIIGTWPNCTNGTIFGTYEYCQAAFGSVTYGTPGIFVLPLQLPPQFTGTHFSQVLAAGASFGLTTDGQILAWGTTSLGAPYVNGTIIILPNSTFPGLYYTKMQTMNWLNAYYAIRSDDAVIAWGDSLLLPVPQYVNETWLTPNVPIVGAVVIPGLPVAPIRDLVCGYVCFVIYYSGEVYSWGFASEEMLGRPTSAITQHNILWQMLDVVPARAFQNLFSNPNRTVIDIFSISSGILIRASFPPCVGPAPSPLFFCLDGTWTVVGNIVIGPGGGNSTNGTEIVISGPTQVVGNVTILPGGVVSIHIPAANNGTTPLLNVSDCASVSGSLNLTFSQESWNTVKGNLSGSQILLLESSCAMNASQIASSLSQPDDCLRSSASFNSVQTDSGRPGLTALFTVDSSQCKKSDLWWIILAAAGGGVVLLVASIIIIWRIVRHAKLQRGATYMKSQ